MERATQMASLSAASSSMSNRGAASIGASISAAAAGSPTPLAIIMGGAKLAMSQSFSIALRWARLAMPSASPASSRYA
eukprot:4995348-Pyramimonas_sp.AAC.1